MKITDTKSKISTKHLSYQFKYTFDSRKYKSSSIIINLSVSAKIQNNIMHVKIIILGILLHVVVKIWNI